MFIVEDDVKASLESRGAETLRLYSAACAERMAQIFIGCRASGTDRPEDVDLFVDTLQRLWDTEDALRDHEDVAARIEDFPEMQPSETGLTDSAAIHRFYSALTLRHAVLAVGAGDPGEAVNCGHVALTSMFQLDQTEEGGPLYADEKAWQRTTVEPVADAAALRSACAEAGLGRLAAVRG